MDSFSNIQNVYNVPMIRLNYKHLQDIVEAYLKMINYFNIDYKPQFEKGDYKIKVYKSQVYKRVRPIKRGMFCDKVIYIKRKKNKI